MKSVWTARLNAYELGKRKHSAKQNVRCPYCSLPFSNKGGMQRHVNSISVDITIIGYIKRSTYFFEV